MTDKKIASTPERAPATNMTDNTQHAQTEQGIVLNHLLRGDNIHSDLALEKYGIKHLHGIIPELELKVPIKRDEIVIPHPRTNKRRPINLYWIDKSVITRFTESVESREELRKVQQSIRIAKSRARNNKTLEKMCMYCQRSTMESKLDEIYGKQAANDDQF